MAAKIDWLNCLACGACMNVCPELAISCEAIAVVDDEKCIECGACTEECPVGCIALERDIAHRSARPVRPRSHSRGWT